MPTEHSRCPKSRLFSRSERVPSLGGSPVWLRRTTLLPPTTLYLLASAGNISSNNKNNSNRFNIAYSVDKANNVRSTCTLFLPTALGTPPPSYLSLIKKPQRWQVTTGLYGFMYYLYSSFEYTCLYRSEVSLFLNLLSSSSSRNSGMHYCIHYLP